MPPTLRFPHLAQRRPGGQVVQRCDGTDAVEPCGRERPRRRIADHILDVGGCPRSLPCDLDHARREVQPQHPLRALRQEPGECPAPAADVQRLRAMGWKLPQQKPVVVAVVIPPLSREGGDPVKVRQHRLPVDRPPYPAIACINHNVPIPAMVVHNTFFVTRATSIATTPPTNLPFPGEMSSAPS